MRVFVDNIHQSCSDIKILELVPLAGESLPEFSAGAHIDVHLNNGLIRQYSLCNDPRQVDRYRIGILLDRQSRGGSQYIHDHINVGDELEISEPRNLFPLANQQSRALLLAGGIGITPLIAMAETLLNDQIDFDLYYFCQSTEHIAFQERLNSEPFKGKVHFIHGNREETRIVLSEILDNSRENVHLYTCGPNGFMEAIFEIALANGWDSSRLHKESFQAAEISTENHQAFQVKIASTGEVLEVPAERSITEVLEDNGYFIPVSCEQGVCGTCITQILEGEAEHHDQFLTDDEKNVQKIFTPCCSRSRSGLLVLDL